MSAGFHEKANSIGSVSGATAINLDQGSVQSVTLTASVAFTFTNPPPAGKAYGFTLYVTQGGVDSFTPTFPASVKYAGGIAPTSSTMAGSTDEWVFNTMDGGVTWYGKMAVKGYV